MLPYGRPVHSFVEEKGRKNRRHPAGVEAASASYRSATALSAARAQHSIAECILSGFQSLDPPLCTNMSRPLAEHQKHPPGLHAARGSHQGAHGLPLRTRFVPRTSILEEYSAPTTSTTNCQQAVGQHKSVIRSCMPTPVSLSGSSLESLSPGLS